MSLSSPIVLLSSSSTPSFSPRSRHKRTNVGNLPLSTSHLDTPLDSELGLLQDLCSAEYGVVGPTRLPKRHLPTQNAAQAQQAKGTAKLRETDIGRREVGCVQKVDRQSDQLRLAKTARKPIHRRRENTKVERQDDRNASAQGQSLRSCDRRRTVTSDLLLTRIESADKADPAPDHEKPSDFSRLQVSDAKALTAPSQPSRTKREPFEIKQNTLNVKVVEAKKQSRSQADNFGKVKKQRKRFTKSESIILDSDEPEDSEKKGAMTEQGSAERVGTEISVPDRRTLTAERSFYFTYQGHAASSQQSREDKPTENYPRAKTYGEEEGVAPLVVSRRRRSWTPTRDSNAYLGYPSSADTKDQRQSLARLLQGFEFVSEHPSCVSVSRNTSGEALSKKRRLELVEPALPASVTGNSANKSPAHRSKTVKAARKKPKTITALATRAYQAPIDQPHIQPNMPNLSTELGDKTSDSRTMCRSKKQNNIRETVRKDGVGHANLSKTNARARKGTKSVPAVQLYSPKEARAEESNQDFVFGTSSQLECEESLSSVRKMQAALSTSEAMGLSQSRSNLRHSNIIQVPNVLGGTSLSARQAYLDLWGAAARTSNDQTFDFCPSRSDLPDLPDCAPSKSSVDPVDQPQMAVSVDTEKTISCEGQESDNKSTIDSCARSSPLGQYHVAVDGAQMASSVPLNNHVRAASNEQSFGNQASFHHLCEIMRSPRPLSKFACGIAVNKTTRAVATSVRSSARLYSQAQSPSDARLSHLQATYSTQEKSTTPDPSLQSGWDNIDEISDSNSATSPTPSCRRDSSSTPRLLQLNLLKAPSPSMAPVGVASNSALNDDATDLQSIRQTLFPQITTLVKSAKPSVDTTSLTWHEKILLYDPIVLEDLTLWLHDQGLRVESAKSRVNVGSKRRKRKQVASDSSETKVLQNEIKPWMVQKWCEEHSICCLWKEGLRGGVKTKY